MSSMNVNEEMMDRTSTVEDINRAVTKRESVVFTNETDEIYDVLKSAVVDGIAYFMLMICICFTGGDPTKFICGVWCLFMVFGNISGAHVNPIITFGLWLYNGDLLRKGNILKLVFYLTFQLLGAFFGCMVSYFIIPYQLPYIKSRERKWFQDFVVESVFGGTFVFVALFISSHSTRPSEKNYVNLTLLSLWLLLIINVGSNVSGSSYNPTFFLILNGFAYFVNKVKGAYDFLWLMLIAPFIGSASFSMLFKYVFRPYYISKNRRVISDE
jgi:glycerol uptake facilitator-like aquaporin